MGSKIHDRLQHAAAALLLSAGVLIPVLGIMDSSFSLPQVLIFSIPVIVLFELLSLHKIPACAGAGAALIAAVVWAVSPGGSRILSDLTVAVALRIRGIDTALPLVKDSAVIVTTTLITVLCLLATLRKATCIPSLMLSVGTAMLVWLSSRMDLVPWLIPAFISAITLLMLSRHPDTSFIHVLPAAAGIVLVAFLLSGNGAEIPSLKNKADELRQSVMDRLFFTETRDVFSLYSVGYSPQGPDQLGGKPNPSGETVMTVHTPDVVYLRGAVYDEYTGRSWRNTAGGRRFLWQSERMTKDRTAIFDLNLPSAAVANSFNKPISISVQMETESASTLFVPQRIRDIVPGTNMVPYYSNSSELFITRNLKPGDAYSVTAPAFLSDDPGIGNYVDLCMKGAGQEERREIPDLYLSLPSHLDTSVRMLAAEITRDAPTPFDQARMIQQYLMQNYEYTLDVEDQPPEYDFVTTFLMSTRKGYCTYFATAMTVLCRLNGLPSRYVEGYLVRPDQNGTAVVTGEDAHAWTEVYFEGFGWLTFDATPGRNDADGQPGTGRVEKTGENENQTEPTPSPEPPKEPEKTPAPSPEPSPETEPEPTHTPAGPSPSSHPENQTTPKPDDSAPPEPDGDHRETDGSGQTRSGTEITDGTNAEAETLWLILPLLLIIVFVTRIILTSPSVKEHFAGSESVANGVWIQEIFDLLSAEGFMRGKGETPISFTDRVDKTGIYSASIRPVGDMISTMVYGKTGISAEERQLIRDTAVVIRHEIKRPSRVRYWCRRIFLSSGHRDWRNQ